MEVALRLLQTLADPSAVLEAAEKSRAPGDLDLKTTLHNTVFKVCLSFSHPAAGTFMAPTYSSLLCMLLLQCPHLRITCSSTSPARLSRFMRLDPRPLSPSCAYHYHGQGARAGSDGSSALCKRNNGPCIRLQSSAVSAIAATACRSYRWRMSMGGRWWRAARCASARTGAAWTPTATGRCTGASRRRTTIPLRSSQGKNLSGDPDQPHQSFFAPDHNSIISPDLTCKAGAV